MGEREVGQQRKKGQMTDYKGNGCCFFAVVYGAALQKNVGCRECP